MSSSPQRLVRPGYGPTLPEIVARWPRPARIAARAAGVLLVAAVVAWVLFGRETGITRLVFKEPVPFNVGYRAPFSEQEPRGGELVRFEGSGQEFVVRPLRVPPYSGTFSTFLPLYSSRLAAQMERERPGLTVRTEGRVNINKSEGYQLSYQVRTPGGKRRYGRRVLMLPEPNARVGVQMLLEADASAAVVNPQSVGQTGPLKVSLRSFRFGTDTP